MTSSPHRNYNDVFTLSPVSFLDTTTTFWVSWKDTNLLQNLINKRTNHHNIQYSGVNYCFWPNLKHRFSVDYNENTASRMTKELHSDIYMKGALNFTQNVPSRTKWQDLINQSWLMAHGESAGQLCCTQSQTFVYPHSVGPQLTSENVSKQFDGRFVKGEIVGASSEVVPTINPYVTSSHVDTGGSPKLSILPSHLHGMKIQWIEAHNGRISSSELASSLSLKSITANVYSKCKKCPKGKHVRKGHLNNMRCIDCQVNVQTLHMKRVYDHILLGDLLVFVLRPGDAFLHYGGDLHGVATVLQQSAADNALHALFYSTGMRLYTKKDVEKYVLRHRAELTTNTGAVEPTTRGRFISSTFAQIRRYCVPNFVTSYMFMQWKLAVCIVYHKFVKVNQAKQSGIKRKRQGTALRLSPLQIANACRHREKVERELMGNEDKVGK